MALREGDRANFETLQRACTDGMLALMECQDASTGEYRAVICAVQFNEATDEYDFMPLAEMAHTNPYEQWVPPVDDDSAMGVGQ